MNIELVLRFFIFFMSGCVSFEKNRYLWRSFINHFIV